MPRYFSDDDPTQRFGGAFQDFNNNEGQIGWPDVPPPPPPPTKPTPQDQAPAPEPTFTPPPPPGPVYRTSGRRGDEPADNTGVSYDFPAPPPAPTAPVPTAPPPPPPPAPSGGMTPEEQARISAQTFTHKGYDANGRGVYLGADGKYYYGDVKGGWQVWSGDPSKLTAQNQTVLTRKDIPRPTTARDQSDLMDSIINFGGQHPGANPSVLKDPGYWARRITETHGNGPIDWGYWEGRMMQPEGPPEGSALTKPGPRGNPGPTSGGASGGASGAPSPNPVQLGSAFGGPQSPAPFGGPNVQVGQDPFSQLLTGGLADVILRSGVDPGAKNKRLESIQENMNRAKTFQRNNDLADLANRGMLSEPGHNQGPTASSLDQLEQHVTPIWSQAIRDASVDEDKLASQNYLSALGLGTGRQQMLSDIALRSLEDNMQWNQFIANYGLNKDKIMYELQQGNFQQLLPLIQAFIQSANTSAGGFI